MILRALLLVLLVAVSGGLSDDSIQLSESFGGPHGTEFSDEASVSAGQTVGSITIRAGERVDGVSLEVTGPKAATFTHGGAGGDGNTLKLAAGEHITSMEAHWGKKDGRTRIFYLSFGTSAGNSVAGGSMTEDKNTVTAPEGFQLGGFFGRDGEEIDSLGAIWALITPKTEAPATEPPPPPTEAPAPEKPEGSSSVEPPLDSSVAASTAASTEASAAEPAEDSAAASTEASAAVETEAPAPEPEKPIEAPAKPAPTISVEDSVQLSESFGGPHGTEFSDEASATSGQTVAAITILAGERVDGVSIDISSPKAATFHHGGTGGTKNTLTLAEGERITSMEVHWGKKSGRTRVFYLSFGTSAGNSVAGGTQTEDKNSVTAPEGFQLGGFFGRDGDEIDSIGAVWTSIELVTAAPTEAPAPEPAPEPAPGPATDEAPGTVKPAGPAKSGVKNTRATILSESFGGPHGNQFSDQPLATSAQTVASLTIRAAARVDGLTLEVSGPTAQTFTHGGPGGKESKLVLKEGEYITSMEAHWGQKSGRTRIFYLSFGTSEGDTVAGGTQTEEKGSVTAPEGYQLGGFFGRDGDNIDLLGVVWTSIEPVAEAPKGGAGAASDEDIQLSPMYGGPHGVAFSDVADIVLGQTLSSVTLRGDARVDAVTLQVEKPAELTWSHGGNGGTETTLTLGPGEYINSMEIHWGKKSGRTKVFYVSFTTSEGKSVAAGTKTEETATETAPEGFQLGGLYGRAEGEVDQLGAIWIRIAAKPALLTDSMGSAWYGHTIRNWVGPTIGNAKDTACYRKTVPFDSKNICPVGYGKDDDDCITQCPMAYPVSCALECIPQNDDCALNIAQKIASVAAVAFNAATAGLFGQVKAAYTTAKKLYLCAAAVISIIKSLIFYLRFTQTTAPQGDTEKLLAVAYQSDVVLVDLPVAVYSCLGLKVPPKLQWTGIVLMIVENIVKQAIINGDVIVSSAENVVNMLTNTSAIKSPDSSVSELQDFMDKNTSCGFELKQLTDRVIFAVSDVRNKTPNAAIDDIRVTISKSPVVLHDIPTVTNNCMKEMLGTKTKQAAFETRDLLRKTVGVIIDQLIETGKTDMGESVKEDDYFMEVANLGLTVLGGMDPTGVVYMVSQFVQPTCGPTSFIGEIDDGNLYDALGLTTVDQAFVGSYGWWSKTGDGVVRLIFESTDKEDVTVVIHSGGDNYAEVDVAAGDTVTWESTVSELQDKTLYLDRWRPGLLGMPGSGGGSLLIWVPRASEGGNLLMHVRINVS